MSLSSYTVLKNIIDNRIRILNESIDIMETSQNINTVIKRKNVAVEEIHWFIKQEQDGLPVILKPSASEGLRRLSILYNDSLYKLIQSLTFSQIQKYEDLKTESAKSKTISKAFELLNNEAHLDKSAENYPKIKTELEVLYSIIENIQ